MSQTTESLIRKLEARKFGSASIYWNSAIDACIEDVRTHKPAPAPDVVERVAKALFNNNVHTVHEGFFTRRITWDELAEGGKEHLRNDAKAAIAAMNEGKQGCLAGQFDSGLPSQDQQREIRDNEETDLKVAIIKRLVRDNHLVESHTMNGVMDIVRPYLCTTEPDQDLLLQRFQDGKRLGVIETEDRLSKPVSSAPELGIPDVLVDARVPIQRLWGAAAKCLPPDTFEAVENALVELAKKETLYAVGRNDNAD